MIGQALLARRMGKPRVIAETGAGQHGVATATACALFGLECVVYMGEVDVERQELNVFRMKLLGAEVVPVSSGSRTLKDAINEALRDWLASVETTYYCLGSVMGPHPYPWMVRELQRVVGDEARAQCRAILDGADPDYVVACVGGGSNAAGTFAGFVDTDAAPRGGRGRRWRRDGAGHPRRRARLEVVPPAGRARPGARGALDLGRSRLSRRRSRARPPRGVGPGDVRVGRRRRRCSTRSNCWRAPRASSLRSSPPTRSPGSCAPRAPARSPAGSTVLVTMSGRGDKDAEQVMGLLGRDDRDARVDAARRSATRAASSWCRM